MRETDTTAKTFGKPAKFLRGSWQIETIEVAETIRFENLASKCDVRQSNFNLSLAHILDIFNINRDSLILIFERMTFNAIEGIRVR